MKTYIINKSQYSSVNFSHAKIASNKNVSIQKNEQNNYKNSLLQFQFTDSLFFILLILAAIIAYVKISGKKYYQRIFNSITSFAYSNSFIREKNLAYTLYNWLLTAVFIVSSSILLLIISDFFSLTPLFEGNWQRLASNFLFIIVFLLIHTLCYYVLGIISDRTEIFSKYIFFFFNLLRIGGTISVFLLFGAVFTENTIHTAFLMLILAVIIIAYFLRFFRIISLFFENQFSLYYLILYFCALEIMPILLIYKILNNNFV